MIRYQLCICQAPYQVRIGWQIEIRSSESAMIWILVLYRREPAVGSGSAVRAEPGSVACPAGCRTAMATCVAHLVTSPDVSLERR